MGRLARNFPFPASVELRLIVLFLAVELPVVVMTVPHASLHVMGAPLADAAIGTLVLGALFGLPLSGLMLRYGLVSAILAHALIDVVRVVVLGW